MGKLICSAAAIPIFLLGACTGDADAKDFQASAESHIESTEVETQAGTTFTDARCVVPEAIKAGETFTCTAVDADGATWDFDLEITSENSFGITGALRRR